MNQPLFIGQIKYDGLQQKTPERESTDQVEHWPKASRIASGIPWLKSKVDYMRWVGDPEQLKSAIGIIE